MALPVPFGFSVGDFIALGQIFRDAAQALKDTGGAAESFQEVDSQFRTWLLVLQEIGHLTPTGNDVSDINAIKAQAQALADVFKSFQNKISKYGQDLGHQGRGGLRHGTRSKLQWALLVEKEVEKFRQSTIHRITTLQMLLQLVLHRQASRQQTEHDLMLKTVVATINTTSSTSMDLIRTSFVQAIDTGGNATSAKLDAFEKKVMIELEKLKAKQNTTNLQTSATRDAVLAYTRVSERSQQRSNAAVLYQKSMKESNRSSNDNVSLVRMDDQVLQLKEMLAAVLTPLFEYGRAMWLSFMRLILALWPQLLLYFRTSSLLSKRLLTSSASDYLYFHDVLGRTHWISAGGFGDWDFFVGSLTSCLESTPISGRLMERLLANKVAVLDADMNLLGKDNWRDKVQARSHLYMSVLMDEIDENDDSISQFHCPTARCRGGLTLHKKQVYICGICLRTFIVSKREHVPLSDFAEAPQQTSSAAPSTQLKDLLYQTENPFLEKVLRAEKPFLPVHNPFQKVRREVGEEFVVHCEKRIQQFEDLNRRFNVFQSVIQALGMAAMKPSQAQSQPRAGAQSDEPADVSKPKTSVAKKHHRTQSQLNFIPNVVFAYGSAAAVARYNRDNARLKLLDQKTRRITELLELEDYHRVHLASSVTSPENIFLAAMKSNDAGRIAKALIGVPDPDSLRGFGGLQMATIGRHGHIVDLLLELGLNPFAKVGSDESALENAVVAGDIAILLSLLTAADCVWVEHLKKDIMDEQSFAQGVHAALKTAVRERKHLLVELFLFFGANPFYIDTSGSTSSRQCPFELAAALGYEDIIASFIAASIDAKQMTSARAFALARQIISTSEKEPLIMPEIPYGTCVFRKEYTIRSISSTSMLEYLCSDVEPFSRHFINSPLATMANTLAKTVTDHNIESGLKSPLCRLSAYFVHHETSHTPLIDRLLQDVDRACQAVTELADQCRADPQVTDVILARCCEQETDTIFNWLERVERLILVVDSNYPHVKQPNLDKAAYWRLQTEGFLFIIKTLCDIKNTARQLREELHPLWRKLKKVTKGNRLSHGFSYHVKRSILLSEGRSYTLTIEPSKAGTVSEKRVVVHFPETRDSEHEETRVNEIVMTSARYERLKKFREKFGILPNATETRDLKDLIEVLGGEQNCDRDGLSTINADLIDQLSAAASVRVADLMQSRSNQALEVDENLTIPDDIEVKVGKEIMILFRGLGKRSYWSEERKADFVP